MNRRAEWAIIGLTTINPTSCQVVLRDSGNSSVGRCKIFKLGVSIPPSKRINAICQEVQGKRRSRGTMYNQVLLNPQQVAGVIYSQAEAVKVEVCVSLWDTVTCVAFTPGQW